MAEDLKQSHFLFILLLSTIKLKNQSCKFKYQFDILNSQQRESWSGSLLQSSFIFPQTSFHHIFVCYFLLFIVYLLYFVIIEVRRE